MMCQWFWFSHHLHLFGSMPDKTMPIKYEYLQQILTPRTMHHWKEQFQFWPVPQMLRPKLWLKGGKRKVKNASFEILIQRITSREEKWGL